MGIHRNYGTTLAARLLQLNGEAPTDEWRETSVDELAALARRGNDGPTPTSASKAARRIKLWEFTSNIHCSVVGTCASMADLHRLARKLRIDFKPGTTDYDVHGYFVNEIARETPASKLFHKMMDARHTGAIRRVGRAVDDGELLAIWCEFRDKGAIAAGYWALMTHAHVSADLRTLLFGEVHMLSHILGTSYQERTAEAADLRTELSAASDKLRRMANAQSAALAARDEEIARLRAEGASLRMAVSAAGPAVPSPVCALAPARSHSTAKRERALQSVRVRARQAERRVEELERQLKRARTASAKPPTFAAAPDHSASGVQTPRRTPSSPDITTGGGRAVLYLGGHARTVDRLRDIAQAYDCQFHHHDGGLEDGLQRLDQVLPSVDCVLCPVNCISHDASLRAKRVCHAMKKPFVPLRSASQSAFRKALIGVMKEERGHGPN